MRVVVVGAGIVGASSALSLARGGHRVTLIEQFDVDHDRGSSFGASRIIRRTYPDAFYTKLMNAAYPLWERLERDAGESLLVRCGGLFFGRRDNPEAGAMRAALRASGTPFEELDADAARVRFPAFALDATETAIFEPDAGFLRASRCVRAAVRLAARAGAEIRTGVRVAGLDSDGAGVAVRLLSGERVVADRAIVAAGPWAAAWSRGARLPLTVTRQGYVNLAIAADAKLYEPERMPVWIDVDTYFYGFPQDGETPGVKLARHVIGETIDANSSDRVPREEDRAAACEYAARRLPGLSATALLEKVCLYTMTPDTDFVVDRLPGVDAAVLVAGLSGHGFKFAILLGEIAASIATAEAVPFDLRRFALRW